MTKNLVLNPRQRAMLAEMGVRVWLPSQQVTIVPARSTAANVLNLPVRREPPLRLPVVATLPAAVEFAPLRYMIGNMPAHAASYAIVLVGEPCTGDAEKLLANILRALGENTFVAQLVPAHGVSESLPEQLAKFPAKIILTLGPHSAKALLGEVCVSTPFDKLRGVEHKIPFWEGGVFVTYHPLKLLKQGQLKAQAWIDLKQVLRAARRA